MKRGDARDPVSRSPLATEQIATAVLYEGYLLYPYRLTALKNRYRWVFGVLFPCDYCKAAGDTEPWMIQTECLLRGDADTTVHARVRFLHLSAGSPVAVPLSSGEKTTQRELIIEETIGSLQSGARELSFRIPSQAAGETDGSYRCLEGRIEWVVRPIERNVYRLTLRIENHTPMDLADHPDREEALRQCLISTHTVLNIRQGDFLSLCDPPPALREAAAACCNLGSWPVLVGEEGRRDTMLSAPIILYDYPKVAPESPGDFFDGTEMDEMLTLRVLTLTDDEKREMRTGGEHARALLDRTESLSEEQMLGLHGVVRGMLPSKLCAGAQVRLKPRGKTDAMDIVLNGMTATVVSVEWDYEGQPHLAVTVDEDPGQDLGRLGQPGHRFFFRPEEVELLDRAGEVIQ